MSSELKDPQFHARLAEIIGTEAPFAWAAWIGISKGAFHRIWNEGTVPGPEHLRRIKEKTGFSIDWMLTGTGPMKRDSTTESNYHVQEGQPKYSTVTTNYDKELNEIIEILQNDLPDAKKFVLKVLRGKKEIKEGLKGLGLNGDIDEDE